MKKIISLLVCVLALAGCTLEYEYDPAPTTPGHTSGYYVEYEVSTSDSYYYDDYYDYCEDPYWYEPEWCDWYSDGTCCVWYTDGWYEEWCEWDYSWCWDYSGSF